MLSELVYLLESLSRSSFSINIQAGGDQDTNSATEQLKSKCIRRWSLTKQQGEVDSRSSGSLQVHIGDLADVNELKKLTHMTTVRQQQSDSSSPTDRKFIHLIEDARILNGFRQHSNDVLALLSEPHRLPYLLHYGERDTGRRLLSIAAAAGWYEGVLFLLNRDANVNETDRENRTALMDCLTSIDTKIIIALVRKRHCNLDIQTLTGHTAAHYAVLMNKVPFFEILIRSGARLDLRNDKGEHVLHHIIVYERKACWKIVKHLYRQHPYGPNYLKHLIHTETCDRQSCLTLAYAHRPNIYFFRELLPYTDSAWVNRELYRSWPKAYKLIGSLFS